MSLGLAAPLWLLGLLGLTAPLVLHLLARGRGRRVRVGSVRLLTDSLPRRPRRLQLQRPLLLALRCLLLALVALALAGPRLRREVAASVAPRPWVLLEPGVDANAAEAVRRAIAAGAEVRMLATGLPRPGSRGDASPLPDVAGVPGGLWSLLREAAAAAPPGTRLLVVTSGRLAALRGERPALANAVEWHEVPDARPNRWVARALATEAGPALVVGESDRQRTTFTVEKAAGSSSMTRGAGEGALSGDAGPLTGGGGRGHAEDAVVGDNTVPSDGAVPSDDALAGIDAVPDDDGLPGSTPSSLRVAVLAAADRQDDAHYVHAALVAAAEAAGEGLELVPARPLVSGAHPAAAAAARTGSTDQPRLASAQPPATLTFWLGDAAPPAPALEAVRSGGVLVTDSGSRGEACDGAFTVTASSAPVELHKCGAGADRAGSDAINAAAPQRAAWRTDSGRAVLVEQSIGRGRWLRFASRFHPAWSDLVLSPAFPEWLRDLLRAAAGGGATAERPASDRRADGGQGKPATTALPHRTEIPAVPRPAAAPPSPAPERAAWLLLFPLLLAERWLATRR